MTPPRQIDIRAATIADREPVSGCYRRAFPDDDLVSLAGDLLDLPPPGVLNLVAVSDDRIVGHVAFTRCALQPPDAAGPMAALLAPLAVDPDFRRQGVGSNLVRDGFRRLSAEQPMVVLVLGDPGYYARFGFVSGHGIAAPYALPESWLAAWQAVTLPETTPMPTGRLVAPSVWQRPELWLP